MIYSGISCLHRCLKPRKYPSWGGVAGDEKQPRNSRLVCQSDFTNNCSPLAVCLPPPCASKPIPPCANEKREQGWKYSNLRNHHFRHSKRDIQVFRVNFGAWLTLVFTGEQFIISKGDFISGNLPDTDCNCSLTIVMRPSARRSPHCLGVSRAISSRRSTFPAIAMA